MSTELALHSKTEFGSEYIAGTLNVLLLLPV